MSAYVNTLSVRRQHGSRVWRSTHHTVVWLSIVAALITIGLGALAMPTEAHAASAMAIPESVGSFARSAGERWGYLYSNLAGVGASITTGTRSDTRKVTRTVEYGISANEGGLKFDAVAEHTVRYEVYVSGAKKGQIYRVYQPEVVFRRASGSLFYLWKLTTSLKSAILSRAQTASGGEVYKVKHQVTLSLPRQPLLPQTQWIELARQLAEATTGSYVRSITIVPNGGWGRLVVGFN